MKRYLYQVIYFLLLIYQTYSIAIFRQSETAPLYDAIQNASAGGVFLSLFAILSLIVSIYLLFSLRCIKNEPEPNRRLVMIIFLYAAYQILVILPLSYFGGMDAVALQRLIVSRLAILLIPFFLWFVIPAFKRNEKPFFYLNISAVLLVLVAFWNYVSGNFMITNTGQTRLLWGGAVLTFATVFFTNFFRQRRSLINYFLIFLSLLGVILVNSRSASIYLLAVILVGVWLFSYTPSRLKITIVSSLIVCAMFFIFVQNNVIWENFSQRIGSTNLQDGNAQIRFQGWQLAYEHFKDNPINGSMSQNEYYRTIYSDQMIPHNFVFELLPTQGIVGLAFYLYLLIYSLAIAYKNRKDELSLHMFLSLLFYLLFATFNPTLLNLWNTLIMILAIATILYRNKELVISHNHNSYDVQ